MKYQILSLLKDIFALVMNYIVSICIWFGLSKVVGAQTDGILAVAIILVPIVFYVIRRYVEKLVLFVLTHLSVVVPIIWFFKGGIRETILLVALLAAFTISSIVVRANGSAPGENTFHPVSVGGIMVALVMLLNHFECFEAITVIARLGVLYATLYFGNLYIKRFIWFDYVNRNVITHMPTKNLLKASAPLIGVVASFYAVFSVICLNDNLISSISEFLRTKFRAFVSWLLSFATVGKEDTEIPEMVSNSFDSNPFEELTQYQEPSRLLQIIEKITIYLAVVLIGAGTIYLLGKAIIFFIRYFSGTDKSDSLELTEEYVEEREKIIPKKKKEKTQIRFRLQPSDKIRNLYIKLVKKNDQLSLTPEKVTAREFSKLFSDEDRDSAFEFALIYERARYSPDACTTEDYKLAKNILSKLI